MQKSDWRADRAKSIAKPGAQLPLNFPPEVCHDGIINLPVVPPALPSGNRVGAQKKAALSAPRVPLAIVHEHQPQ